MIQCVSVSLHIQCVQNFCLLRLLKGFYITDQEENIGIHELLFEISAILT